jgi:hypothetical protein
MYQLASKTKSKHDFLDIIILGIDLVKGRMYANGRSVVITGNIYLLVTIFVLFFELDNKFIA